METREKVLIVIPAYNEEANIGTVVKELVQNYPEFDYIVVNDGSRDQTARICREHGYQLLDLPVNLGLAGCFQAGMKYAWQRGYSYAIQFDGDGQHRPEYIESMRKKMDEGYEIVIGDAVIDRLVELRLFDDEDYARMVVRACVSRMMGMRGAVIELTRKGVDRAIAQSVAQEAAEQGVFDEAAWELGRSVARKARACSVEVQRRRFWGAGGRKGHDPKVLREVAHALFSADASEE